MKMYLLMYAFLAAAGLIFNSLGECLTNLKTRKTVSNIGFIITIIAGITLGIGFCSGSASSGLYTVKVNGVKTTSGAIYQPLFIIIGVIIGLFTNLLSAKISQGIAKLITDSKKDK